MSIPYYFPKETFTGTGSNDSYTFNFHIDLATQLLVVVVDADGEEVQRVRGDDTTFLDSLVFDAENGGGTVTLQANLPINHRIALILDNEEPTQGFQFRNKRAFTLRKFEQALDNLMTGIQGLVLRTKQALRIHDLDDQDAFNAQLPPGVVDNAGNLLMVSTDGTRFQFGPNVEDLQGAIAASGLPPGGNDGDFLEGDTAESLGAVWKSADYDGISALTGAQFTSNGLKDTLDKIIRITYTPPTIVLSMSPAQSVREKGTVISSVDMFATITKKSNNIGVVRYYRSGVLVNTNNSPSPSGGVDNYTNNTAFSDNLSFYAEVDDILASGNGPTTVQSNTVSFPFVYPYYSGAGAPGRTPAQVAAMTKDVRASTASLNKSFTTSNGDVYYFAYPASYGALTSIKDENNFETFSDWTLTTANITGLDGNAVSYRIYEFNNPVIAGSTNYTFIR